MRIKRSRSIRHPLFGKEAPVAHIEVTVQRKPDLAHSIRELWNLIEDEVLAPHAPSERPILHIWLSDQMGGGAVYPIGLEEYHREEKAMLSFSVDELVDLFDDPKWDNLPDEEFTEAISREQLWIADLLRSSLSETLLTEEYANLRETKVVRIFDEDHEVVDWRIEVSDLIGPAN